MITMPFDCDRYNGLVLMAYILMRWSDYYAVNCDGTGPFDERYQLVSYWL